ncbi:MAG TPA: DUF2322 family protein [Azonexus sp.]|jgi:hypothetical protein|nr:DUF2322 family protein [Azonexus sp.]
MSFAENLKKLPGTSHLAAINLFAADGNVVATIENKPGSQGSLAVYNHLAQTYGSINHEAARKGLEIFAEHTDDARSYPGKHPNIDRLIAIEQGGPALRVKHLFEV